MAYYPDFYHPSNIIGYSGNLHNKPTVYFMRRTAYGYRIGRIIQRSSNSKRIGRAEVREYPRYRIGNRGGRVAEWYDKKIRKGRRAFVPAQRLNMSAISILTRAIERYPNRAIPSSFDPPKYWET
ncbi:MAG: hypothetical protein AAGF87_00440 [Bacteroidota bacterium]